MSLVLARVDQRLIHGIVVTQWAGATKAKRLMVVDDEVSRDEIQKQAIRMFKPAGTRMSIIDTETAIKNFKAGKYDNHNVFMVVREPQTLIRLKENPKVNIGIMFDGEGKKTVKKMVSVSDQEVADFRTLMNLGGTGHNTGIKPDLEIQGLFRAFCRPLDRGGECRLLWILPEFVLNTLRLELSQSLSLLKQNKC